MKLTGWDTETWPICYGMVAPRLVCLTSDDGSQNSLFWRDPEESWAKWLQEQLSDSQTILIGHNAAMFDAVVCAAERPVLLRKIMDAIEQDRFRCTLIRQALLDIAAGESDFRRQWIEVEDGKELKTTKTGRGLDDLGKLYFGEHWSKGEETGRTRFGELDGIDPKDWPVEQREYALADATRARRIFLAQAERAAELRELPEMQGAWESKIGEIPDENWQTRKALWLGLMSAWGLRTDPVAVSELKASHEAEQARIREKLIPTGLIRPDGTRDMAQIRARLSTAYAILEKEIPFTPKGQISTGGDVLVDSGDEHLIMLGESLSDAATIGTWMPHLEAGTKVPICVGYNPLVDSGRTSARAPNIQNPPRKGKIRQCIVARDSNVFVFCDYDTAELRALAQVCIYLDLPYRDLADALIAGEDPHLSLAASVEGIEYAEALRLLKSGDKRIADTRQLMKIPNFGLPGGLGVERLVEYAHSYDPRFRDIVDLKKATELHSAWFRRWREMRYFFNAVSKAIGRDGSGAIQQFVSKRVRGGVGFTQTANTTFQGLVADGTDRAGWALSRECYLGDWIYPPQSDGEKELYKVGKPSPLLGSRPVLFMHDEFGLEVPYKDRRDASLAADRQASVQRIGMEEVIHDVPIKCSPVMTRRWYKGASAVRIDGMLVPSKPVEEDGRTRWAHDEM